MKKKSFLIHKIKSELVQTEEDRIVEELRNCDGFDEDFIRRRYKELVKERAYQRDKREKEIREEQSSGDKK